MKLRIISGALKGRTINGPDTDLSFRPTLERTRQSIADMLRPWYSGEGALVADICAGSGAFGFEMLSRGANRVDFVENDRGRAGLIRDHTEKFGVVTQCRIVIQDAVTFLDSGNELYSIIFLDPPYDDGRLQGLVPAAKKRLLRGGVLLYQRRRPSRTTHPATPEGTAFEIKTFGDTIVEIHKHSDKE